MANLNLDIIFPAPTATDPAPKPVVSQPYPVAKQFDRINWTVYAVNPNIVETEIDFQLPAHKFFGSSKKFKKPFVGKGTIYGDVPDLGGSSPLSAKYTIRGFDSNGTLVTEEDPVIIVDEP
ncbi:MAG TPA: hypothetical protein VFD07_07745 [Candidatus Krumholzibacteria bacterium]|nr:hypothetical protein [Candidatus Krumholzibacteria bacterium]